MNVIAGVRVLAFRRGRIRVLLRRRNQECKFTLASLLRLQNRCLTISPFQKTLEETAVYAFRPICLHIYTEINNACSFALPACSTAQKLPRRSRTKAWRPSTSPTQVRIRKARALGQMRSILMLSKLRVR